MFHETRFPTAISRAAHGGPERRTDVIVLGSGAEERNARWADSRRSYNAGYGVKSLDDLHAVIAFFEERRGRLHGFRWRDPTDCKSCPPESTPTALDQAIATGDGATAAFQLVKTYGSAFDPWTRAITKPVDGSVLIAVDGVVQTPVTAYGVDPTTGLVAFQPGHIPADDAAITAGFEFDVPVRFDTDKLEISIQGFRHGAIPSKRHALAGSEATIELWQAMALAIAPGDTFTVTAGCDKQFATCQAKFANAVNFRGFPHMPGNDYVLAIARPGDPVTTGNH